MITVVNMIPRSLSGETHQDSEPNLAVNPADPQQIAGSAFTPDPLGSTNAPIFVSTDGGTDLASEPIVPSQPGQATGDITLRFAPAGNTLYAGILRFPGEPQARHPAHRQLRRRGADDRARVDRNNVDQPYLAVGSPATGPASAGKDHVLVGINDLSQTKKTAGPGAPRRSRCRPTTTPPPSGFTSVRLDGRATAGQDAPAIRPAVHGDGTVYGAFYHWTAFAGGIATADVVVVRDDNWGASANPFGALVDPSDHIRGRSSSAAARSRSTTAARRSSGRSARVGSDLSIAVDPNNSASVWVAWADRVGANDYTLHVRHSTDRGATGRTTCARSRTRRARHWRSTGAASSVSCTRQVDRNRPGGQRWVTHFERT